MTTVKIILSFTIVYFCYIGFTQEQGLHNITQWTLSRQKRTFPLLFADFGVHKYIVSFAYPVELFDKKSWRGLYGAWNFQWQHSLPLTVQLWYNSTYFPAKARGLSSDDIQPPLAAPEEVNDLSATFLYAMIESYMNKKGLNGRECIQRAICENAQVNYVGGVFDRIYQRVLTPEPQMEDYYKDAYAMGSAGADCYESFVGCPRGKSIFDQFVRIEDVD